MRTLDSDSCAQKIKTVLRSLKVGSLVVYLRAECPLSRAQKECLSEALGLPTKGKDIWVWAEIN